METKYIEKSMLYEKCIVFKCNHCSVIFYTCIIMFGQWNYWYKLVKMIKNVFVLKVFFADCLPCYIITDKRDKFDG